MPGPRTGPTRRTSSTASRRGDGALVLRLPRRLSRLGSGGNAAAPALARLRRLRDRRPAPADGAAGRRAERRDAWPGTDRAAAVRGAPPAALGARRPRRDARGLRATPGGPRAAGATSTRCAIPSGALRSAPLRAPVNREPSAPDRGPRERVLLGDGAMGTELQ